MKFVAPLRIRVEKNVIVRLQRNLAGKGQLKIKVGQQVSPSDIIGTFIISSGFRTLDLAQLLSVAPVNVEKYLKRDLGQRIYKDELLAFKDGGIFGGKKIVTAPTDGILEFLNPKTGELKMTFLPKKVDLPAGVYGICEQIDNIRGQVLIRTQVSRIHGMFGSGRLRDGTLYILGRRDSLIGRMEISPKYGDNILVGGSLIYKDAISTAISSGVSGFITGGINAKDYKSIGGGRLIFPRILDNDIGISIVVCEGFGSIPIGDDIFEILSEYAGRFVSIDGNRGIINLPSFESSSMSLVEKTHLPPTQEQQPVLDDEHKDMVVELTKGQRVRIIGNSFAGEQGKILSIDKTATLLPSGIMTFLATVETKRRKIQIPVANCEVLD